jgi:hypothetical protein
MPWYTALPMASPIPKHPAERRDAHVKRRGEFIELDKPTLDKNEIKLRPLTKLEKGHYSLTARRTWEIWRRDPVTLYWAEADIQFGLETLELYNDDNWIRNAAELRQRQDRLALTPEGKKKQRYKVTFGNFGTEQSKDRPPKREVVEDPDVIQLDSRRHGLSA